MGKNDSAILSQFMKLLFVAILLAGTALVSPGALANDLPLAAASPAAGFAFDDQPLLLPVQRNFQMAMLTASSELGRSCGKMEAYGWRMNQSEQQRVNQIFNNTVDRLRGLGYVVETQAPTSVSRDITMFTADRSDKHFIFMWSAGELGLVMVLCQSSPSMTGRVGDHMSSVQVFPQTQDVVQSTLAAPPQDKMRSFSAAKFSPVGDWVGSYTCEQGFTGGTLQITKLTGEDFQGIFRFYPTPKNPYVPTGRYTVYGQYDHDSHRILINPGKWLERPKDFYNTIMVGSFDPVSRTFSAYFQGIMGCTSFEAKAATEDYEGLPHKAVKKKHKKKIVKKKPRKAAPTIESLAPAIPAAEPAPASGTAPIIVTPPVPATSGIPIPAEGATSIDLPAPSSTTVVAPVVVPVPVASPAPAPAAAPASVPVPPGANAPPVPLTVPNMAPPPVPVRAGAPLNLMPAPAAVNPAVPAPVPPTNTVPAADPVPPPTPVPPAGPLPMNPPTPTAPDSSAKPSGSIEPLQKNKYIQLASNSGAVYVTPTIPQAPQGNYINNTVPPVQPAIPVPNAQYVSPAYAQRPVVQEANPGVNVPQPTDIIPVVNSVPPVTQVQPPEPVPTPNYLNPYVPPVQPPDYIPNNKPPNYP